MSGKPNKFDIKLGVTSGTVTELTATFFAVYLLLVRGRGCPICDSPSEEVVPFHQNSLSGADLNL